MCKWTWTFSSFTYQILLLSSLHFSENFLVGLERKHMAALSFSSLPLPTQHSSKSFISSLSLIFFPSSLKSILPNTPLSVSISFSNFFY